MKIRQYTLLLLLLAGCAKHVDFEFYDAMGRLYSTNTLEASFSQHYGHSYSPFVILVEISDKENAQYKKQYKALEQLDWEQVNAIYVVANKTSAETSGYYVKPELANKMMPSGVFRIRMISPEGLLLKESQHVMSALEIEVLISKNKSKK